MSDLGDMITTVDDLVILTRAVSVYGGTYPVSDVWHWLPLEALLGDAYLFVFAICLES